MASSAGKTTNTTPDKAAEAKAAEDKALADAKAAEEQSGDQGGDQGEGSGDAAASNESGAVTEGPAGNSGPGTGTSAPPESTYRMPSTIISDNDDNPLAPPSDHKTQTLPEAGHSESSTDPVYAALGGRTMPGEDFSAYVDENGRRVRASSIFDESDETKTFVIVKKRIYEQFYYPNTTEIATRLAFVEGDRVPRAKAAAIKDAVQNAPTPRAEA